MLDGDNLGITATKITVLGVCSAISHFDHYLKKASTFFWRTCGLIF
jgi:hypothetical protein